MNYVKLLNNDELVAGEKTIVEVNGEKYVVANLDGEFFVLNNRCPHLGGSLGDGDLTDGKLVCPRHGAIFDVRSGANLGNAKIAFISMKVKDADAYPVRIEDGAVLADLT